MQPVSEACLLQGQVVLDVAQLLCQRRERSATAERVAGEVGELQKQITGPVGVGADERGDGGKGVVDEVRADLRSQRSQLGLHGAGPLAAQVGKLDLC